MNLNHERPVPEIPLSPTIESAIAKQVVRLDEQYIEDQIPTVFIPDEKLPKTKILPEQSMDFDTTQEGKKIAALKEKLWAFGQAIGVNNLSYGVQPHYARNRDLYNIPGYQDWVEDNKIQIDLGQAKKRPIDFACLKEETLPGTSKDESELAIQAVRDADSKLEELREELIRNPQFAIGKEVAVSRNPKTEDGEVYLEGGWRVHAYLASGLVRVYLPSEKVQKDVPLDRLKVWSV